MVSTFTTRYLNHTRNCGYLHGPMVPGRGWRGGQCWGPWSGSGLLHNWWWTPRTLVTAEAAATSLLCPSSTFPGFHFKYRLCRALVITTVPLLLTIAWRGRVIDFYHPSLSTRILTRCYHRQAQVGKLSLTQYLKLHLFLLSYTLSIYCRYVACR